MINSKSQLENFIQSLIYGQIYKMNKQQSESEALFKIVRLFIVQYAANVHNYKNVQNQAINMLATHVVRLIREMILQMKRILSMQGRTQPNCLHQLFAIKQLGIVDFQKICSFLIQKRYLSKIIEVTLYLKSRSKSYKFPHVFFQKTISKVFQNDIQLANRYEKEKHYSTIRTIKSPYLFNFSDQSDCLPFRCGIDQAFNKPAEFTYKNTFEKIQREKKNIENLVAFTRRQNRKALGLYLDSLKQDQKPQKKVKYNEQQEQVNKNKVQSYTKKSKQFDYIGFL